MRRRSGSIDDHPRRVGQVATGDSQNRERTATVKATGIATGIATGKCATSTCRLDRA
jgi:hypothetical protein